MPRALKNLDITIGLVRVPVQLFTATQGGGIGFNLLHARCGSRIQNRLECPEHGIVPRDELVRGYEIERDQHVLFTDEELKALEAETTSSLNIDSFVPAGAIDPLYVSRTYYLGSGKGGQTGYRLLAEGLRKTGRVGVGTFTWRGQSTPIAIRPRADGLVLHRLHFAEDVQAREGVEPGTPPALRPQEEVLARRLIEDLSSPAFHPEQYPDAYRARLLQAIETKARGGSISAAETPSPPATTDLQAALEASLARRPPAKATPRPAAKAPPAPARRRRAS